MSPDRRPGQDSQSQGGDVLEQLSQREIERRLHKLGDEGIAFVLEFAATKADMPEAAFAARDLRTHLSNGGAARDFLSKYPQHEGVDFQSLVIDESVLDVSAAFPLLPSTPRPQLEGARGEWAPEVSAEEPELTLSPAAKVRKEELFETYPAIRTLFAASSTWVEEDGNRYIVRKKLQDLFSKKDPEKPMSVSHRAWLMRELWSQWKQLQPEQTGRHIKGKGKGRTIFLTPEEATNFLWFVHRITQDVTSPYRNYTLAVESTSPSEDSKKK